VLIETLGFGSHDSCNYDGGDGGCHSTRDGRESWGRSGRWMVVQTPSTLVWLGRRMVATPSSLVELLVGAGGLSALVEEYLTNIR
jgi:hypothetical protein